MADEILRAFDALWGASEKRHIVPGRMGSYDNAGAKQMRVDGRPGWAHVRRGPDGELGQGLALNVGAPWTFNYPIEMRRFHGLDFLVITGAANDARMIAWTIGTGGNANNVGPHTHRRGSGLEYELEPELMEQGRVYWLTGMKVFIGPFRYQKGDGAWDTWNGGALDLTPYKPATAGTWCWVLTGVDPAANTAVAAAGEAYGFATPLTRDLIDDIAFSDYIPCCAIKVKASDTTLDDWHDYEDAHGWFTGAGPGAGFDVDLIMTDANGAVMVDADGNVMIAS